MPIIVGTIDNAASFPIPLGRITVQLRQPLIDRSTSPDSLLTTLAQSYTITNGVLNSPAVAGTTLGQISLPATANELVSYQFTIEQTIQTTRWYLNDGAEYPDTAPRVLNSGIWYTGAVFVSGESRQITAVVELTYTPILDPFDAILPDVSSIEIVDLIDFGVEFVSNPQAGLSYLAQLITSDNQYLNKLRAGRWVGPYSAAVVYQFGDIVSYGTPSQGWISKNASASTKIAPPSSGTTGNADWDYAPLVNVSNPSVNLSGLVLKAGDTMTGNLVLPAPGGSPPNTLALRQAEADTYYARLANTAQTIAGIKTFSSSPVVPTASAGNNTTNAASTAFVQQELLTLPRLAQPLARVRRNASQSLTVGSNTTIVWDNFPAAGFFDTNGAYTVPAGSSGQYLIALMPLTFQMEGNFSSNERRFRLRVYVSVNNVDVGDLFYEDVAAVNTTSGGLNAPLQFRRTGLRVEALNAGDVLRIVANPTTAGTASFTACTIAAGQANNVCSIWRLAA